MLQKNNPCIHRGFNKNNVVDGKQLIRLDVLRRTTLLLSGICIIAGGWIATGCKTGEKTQDKKSAHIPTDTWYPLYFSGKDVGRGKYLAEVVSFGKKDNVYTVTVIEDIHFRGDHYKFEFVLADNLRSIKILRYGKDDEYFLHSDSFKIMMDVNVLVHIYYENDGETVRTRREIHDKQKYAYTQELFQFAEEFIISMYGSYVFTGKHYRRYEKIRSLGYELLKYDRI